MTDEPYDFIDAEKSTDDKDHPTGKLDDYPEVRNRSLAIGGNIDADEIAAELEAMEAELADELEEVKAEEDGDENEDAGATGPPQPAEAGVVATPEEQSSWFRKVFRRVFR